MKNFTSKHSTQNPPILLPGLVKLFFSIILFLLIQGMAWGQSVGDYRSVANTGWTTLSTWERLNSLPNTWAMPTTGQGYPGQNSIPGNVTIRNGNTVNINVSPANAIGSLTVGGGTSGILEFSTTQTTGQTGSGFTLSITGDVIVNSGASFIVFNQSNVNAHTLNIGGNLTVNGTFNMTTTVDDNTTLVFNGNAQQTISGSGSTCTFYSLTASNTSSAGLILNRNIVLAVSNNQTATNLTVTSGTIFDLGSYTCNRSTTGAGSFVVNANSTLKIGGTNSFPANYSTNTLNATSTVEYNGTNQNLANLTYGNLVLGGSGTKTFGGSRTISGNLSIAGGVIANLGSSTSTANTLTLGGASTINGTWGSTSSAAVNKNDTYFAGTGILNVAVSTCNAVTASVSGHTDITCYAATDGTITVTASGGLSPYSFSSDNGATYVSGDNDASHTFTGLSANEVYKIRVKDASGCESPVIP